MSSQFEDQIQEHNLATTRKDRELHAEVPVHLSRLAQKEEFLREGV